MWEKELEIAKQAATCAGGAIMEIYHTKGDLEVAYKSDSSPLTAADRASNRVIVELLKKEFPTYAILSEEEKDNKERLGNDCCFVVDPLDGTKEFIKRNGQFTVNIALSYKHESVMGVIYVPDTGELYYASKENGAFKEVRSGEKYTLHVSDIADPADIRVVMSSSHGCVEMDALIEKYGFKKTVSMGSSLKGCLVAEGKADIYYRFNPTMEWDTCAMQCIAEEAGAIFRKMDDSRMLYNREDSTNREGFYIINRPQNRFRL